MEISMEQKPASQTSETDNELVWPDRKSLNIRLLFDIGKICHDIANVRSIIDAFDQFKHGVIVVNKRTKNETSQDKIIETWKGITMHAQELNRALKDNRFGDWGEGIVVAESDSDETFCSQVSFESSTSNSVLMRAMENWQRMHNDTN